jgi:hypothetical protein
MMKLTYQLLMMRDKLVYGKKNKNLKEEIKKMQIERLNFKDRKVLIWGVCSQCECFAMLFKDLLSTFSSLKDHALETRVLGLVFWRPWSIKFGHSKKVAHERRYEASKVYHDLGDWNLWNNLVQDCWLVKINIHVG